MDEYIGGKTPNPCIVCNKYLKFGKMMEEAKKQIEASGYGAMTIRSVAKACGVGVGTVYNYFPSKEALVATFMLADWKVCLAAINETGENAADALPVLRCIYDRLCLFTTQHQRIIRDPGAAAGFAGYGVFQNLCVGGQTVEAKDATNPLSYHCICASLHTHLPQPSLSVRVWNGTPQDLLRACAELTKTGIGLPAYYNDEVIVPALMSRGLTTEDARDYNLIGCVEPQKGGKTDGWHDAAFFNMCRPMEFVFSGGMDNGVQVGPKTLDVTQMTSFDEFYKAYRDQMYPLIEDMVDADNAIDLAHMQRAPLPFLSTMIDDCIHRGKSAQEGGAIYNFTGPQGFGVANMADAMIAVKHLVFEDHAFTMEELREALKYNFGRTDSLICSDDKIKSIVEIIKKELQKNGKVVSDSVILQMCKNELKRLVHLLERRIPN